MKRSTLWLPAAAFVIGIAVLLRGYTAYNQLAVAAHLWLYLLLGCASLGIAAFRLNSALRSGRPAAGQHVASPGARETAAGWFGRRDWLILVILLAAFVPAYMIGVRDFPRQMNTDEIAIMNAERVLSGQSDVDIFAPSFYSDLPTFIFWSLGKIGVGLGGVNLGHMRLVHAGSGVLIILMVYVFLRLVRLPRAAALAGTITVGVCHSLFFLSRMAMRDNTALLFELVTLSLLLYAWQRRHLGWALLGGFAGGFTVYTYFPSRITLAVWLAFMAGLLALQRFKGFRQTVAFNLVVLLGFLVIAIPLHIATTHHTATDPYPSQQFLWLNAGRQQERQYRGTATVEEALKINAVHGLLAFNKPYEDEGLLYNHPGAGFVDAATGVLIWLGVIAVIAGWIRKRRLDEVELLPLVGFMSIWLSMALLLTRAPDYTRLLIILPFVGYMVGRAVLLLTAVFEWFLQRCLGLRQAGPMLWTIALATTATVVMLNGLIINDFRQLADRSGDGVGDTLRFQEDHAGDPAQYLFVYGSTQYFYWGIPDYWRGWLTFPKSADQPLTLLPEEQLSSYDASVTAPAQYGYLLTTGDVWTTEQNEFEQKQQVLSVTSLDPPGNRVVVKYGNR